jgi:hypothetical protein
MSTKIFFNLHRLIIGWQVQVETITTHVNWRECRHFVIHLCGKWVKQQSSK